MALALLVGCAEGQHYDSATKANTSITTANSSQGSDSDSDGDSEGDDTTSESGEATSESGEATSESGEATSESQGSGNPSGDPSGNMTWTTSSGGSSTTDDCGGPCDSPPNGCYDLIGECSGSECLYYPLDNTSACDDGDPCTDNDVCDGEGGCQGSMISCSPPANASGGSCVNGTCQGFTCEAPWENCDGNWDNGCEVPTGVANQCDINGLNPEGGCWTAYCGNSNDPKGYNFGDYYCFACSTCQVAGDLVQWCSPDTGNWYPPGMGSCGGYLDLVCGP
ncbi:MAG TPA: hypothetical protein ENK31_01415 [Nannocystis exedens]|nr:hypothetical protein [Nannocystis exedens]